MKSQKGITLISVTIYIIVMVIVVAIVSVISSYFYTNIRGVSDTIDPLTEYTKFNSFFTDEVNHSNIKILECKTRYINDDEAQVIESSYVVFDNGVQYTFVSENKGIYRNKVKICNEVESCNFEYKIQNGKDVVVVNLTIGTLDKNVTYTLKS